MTFLMHMEEFICKMRFNLPLFAWTLFRTSQKPPQLIFLRNMAFPLSVSDAILQNPAPSCFNDYRPVALTPILMKCFERLVMQHIKSVLPPSLDPFQFAYRSNRSTDDAIATALHPTLTHLGKTDTYVRLLFIDFSSAFNTIIPQQLIHKLVQLGLNTSLCNWLLDFLTGRPQAVRVGRVTHPAPSHWTQGPPKDVCWASSSSLCWPTTAHRHTTPTASLNLRMTRLWWVSSATEMRQTTGVRWAAWPGGAVTNNLSLNVEKTKEIVVDFRRVHSLHAPLTINGATVERVSSTKFLGVHITEDLSWTNNTASTSQESTTASLLPPQTKKSQSPGPHHVHLLQRHHREHSD